jgi:hypothetical protein
MLFLAIVYTPVTGRTMTRGFMVIETAIAIAIAVAVAVAEAAAGAIALQDVPVVAEAPVAEPIVEYGRQVLGDHDAPLYTFVTT